MKKLLYSMAVALLLVSGAVTAKADTLIDSWTYSVSGIFVEWKPTKDIYTKYGETLDGTSGYRELSWGAPRGSQSSITLSETATGTVYTDGGDQQAITFSHDNNVVSSAYNTLESGKVYLDLDLTPDTGGEVLNFSVVISFDFYETSNTGPLQDDIFIVTNIEAVMETFEYDGYEYTFSFYGSFWDLREDYSDYLAAYVPAASGYYGWVTKEDGMTVIPTFLAVHSGRVTPIHVTPEPGTVLLLGAGLAGLAFIARRRAGK